MNMAQQTTPAHSQQSELAPPGQFDIMQESLVNEKGDFGNEADFDTFLNQEHRRGPWPVSPGVASSSSSVTVFDPAGSPRERYYFDTEEDDMGKGENAPFLARDVEKEEAPKKAAPEHVTWMSLPRKGQLLILFMCRFVDFLQVASLQAYVFYQLKHLAEQRTVETGGAGMSTTLKHPRSIGRCLHE
jgi:hypothetical protein